MTAVSVLTGALPAAAGDAPAGYYFGTDSFGPGGTGAASPYQESAVGGLYSGYVAEAGTWTDWTGCTSGVAADTTAAQQVDADEGDHGVGQIPGVNYYWFMAGPGADPAYDGGTTEAYAWGQAQAEAAVAGYRSITGDGVTTATTYTPLMFMDIEGGAGGAGTANGWNERVDSCGDITATTTVPVAVDRATFNGFWDYISADTIFHPGVYSSPAFWTETFGTGSSSWIPNTDQWVADWPGGVTPAPVGFCQGRFCASWFGGVTATHEVGWQWAGGTGDYDQWDTANLP